MVSEDNLSFQVILAKKLFEGCLVVQNLRNALIKMFMSSKQRFVRYMSRRLLRMESARKEVAISRKSRAVIGWKNTNRREPSVHNLQFLHEFCVSAEGGVGSFDKTRFQEQIGRKQSSLGQE